VVELQPMASTPEPVVPVALVKYQSQFISKGFIK